MRTQLAVCHPQLVRSKIPHHAGEILMCRAAKLSDPDHIGLFREITDAQEREIGQMERILQQLQLRLTVK